MAFKKRAPVVSKATNPAVLALEAQKQKMLRGLDDQLATARRAAQSASAELSRARHAMALLADNRRTMSETFDALIASAEAEGGA